MGCQHSLVTFEFPSTLTSLSELSAAAPPKDQPRPRTRCLSSPQWFLEGLPVPWELTCVSGGMHFSLERAGLGPRLPFAIMRVKCHPWGF